MKILNKIPEGWQSTLLGDLFAFKNGVNADKSFYGKGIKFINLMDILQGNFVLAEHITGQISLSEKKIQENLVVKGDVLFNRTSEIPDEIGLTSVYLDNEEVVFGGFVIKGHPRNNSLDNMFKKYCFFSEQVRKETIRMGQGAVRTNIGQKDLSRVPILLPPLPEQKAIADLLSTWDEAIEKTERLIEAKEKRFRWLLHELIPNESSLGKNKFVWKKVKLGDVCKIQTGKLDANAMDSNGKFRFYTCAKSYYMINSYAFDAEALIVSGNGANVGYIHYFKGKFNAYQRTYVLDQFPKNIDIQFLRKYLERCLAKRISQEKSESNTPYIRMTALSMMDINIPTLTEQKQIANTLTTAQQEIDLLKQLAEKYKTQKRGLMQKMLTGDWRVKPEIINRYREE